MSASMLTKEQALELLEKIINCEGSEAEIDEWIDVLSNGVPHPHISDLIFYPDRERTPAEIIDLAFAYQPIYLHSGSNL
jgi:Colicin immunity protein / pyocin immunity protein